MNDTASRRMGAIAGTAITIVMTTVAGTAASATAGQRETSNSPPCFMVRSNWHVTDGPQPTCPLPTREKAAVPDTDRRPCFMVRSDWHVTDGPQPTCPVPTREKAAGSDRSDRSDAPRPDPSHASRASCRDPRR